MYILGKDGPIGPVETKFPVLQAEITEKGAVAAVLEDGEKPGLTIMQQTEVPLPKIRPE